MDSESSTGLLIPMRHSSFLGFSPRATISPPISTKMCIRDRVVHSVLHLLGYDHLDEGPQKKQMRAREEAILAELGITREG